MASSKISVIIDVVADRANASLKGFRQSIQDADGAAGKFKAGAAGAMDSVKANAANLAMAGGAALIAFGAKSVAAFQDTALAAGKLRDSLGVTSEEASRLMEVAEDLGIGTATLEKSIGIMNRTATNTPGAFEAIGAELKRNADGTTNVNETFLSTIDALKKIPDASARAAAAQKVFGRGWMEMAELIELGADGVSKALDSVEGGKIIDDSEVERARKFRDSLDALKGVSEELTIAVGGALVPALTEAADAMMGIKNAASAVGDILPEMPGWMDTFTDAASKAINPVGHVVDLLGDLGAKSDDATEAAGWWSGAMVQASIDAALAENATSNLTTATENLTGAYDDQIAALRSKLEADRASTDAVLAAIDSGLAYRNQVAETTAAINESNLAQLDASLSTDQHAQAARDAEAAVLAQAGAAVTLAEDQATANGATLTAEQKANIYKLELQRLADQLNGPSRDAVNGYIETLRNIPSSITTSVKFGSLGSSDYTQPGFGTVKARASGGPVSAGGTYLVGEEGPELLQMGATSGNVIPNGATIGGGSDIFYITMNGVNSPEEFVRQLRTYVRRNGPIKGIT